MILIPIATNWCQNGDLANEFSVGYSWDVFLLIKIYNECLNVCLCAHGFIIKYIKSYKVKHEGNEALIFVVIQV